MNLFDLRGKYKGRVFLVGNGPSLLDLTSKQLGRLKKEYLFMGSRFFDWDAPTLQPAFYVMTERRQATAWLENGWHRLATASIARFWVAWQPAPDGWVSVPQPPSNAHDVLNYGLFGHLEGDCKDGVDNPHIAHGKVTPLAMVQLARYMGFGEFYSIGWDGTRVGEVYNRERVRDMHAPGIETQYARVASGVITDCTPGGAHNAQQGGPLAYRPLDEVLGVRS